MGCVVRVWVQAYNTARNTAAETSNKATDIARSVYVLRQTNVNNGFPTKNPPSQKARLYIGPPYYCVVFAVIFT